MTWPPVSSQEVAEQREAEAEAADAADADARAHRTRCIDGWLDDDDQGRPRPCLICRPHLATPDRRPPDG